jgi:predicted ATPase/class 3 adenylate cyclase
VGLLPSGTVTFLFTDIQGSTKFALENSETWEALRARHNGILQSAIQANNGYVFQIIGDAFCAAFHTAYNGLSAALKAQQNIQKEDWGGIPICVRMGLHTGPAELHGTDYRGYLSLVKVQRLMSVAHGGQVLLSNASARSLQNEFPNGISLRDLKEHRLKGLPDPEHLWQLVGPDLQQDFPPLSSLNEIPNNLPLQLTTFIGREKEIAQIKKRLVRNRLITLTGSGGVGKTRLSIQIASDLLRDFPNGAWFVELAPINDPELVTQTVCSTLGLHPRGNIPALKVLTEYLKPKKSLLVVDNCEHLIDACAQLCDSLLHVCPDLQIIASSREALGIDGENSYRIPSLSLPDPNGGLQSIEESEAVKLFVDRANAVLPAFELTEINAPVVAQICRRLDGIALAIELAASRVKIFKVEQIASRLDDAFRLLTGGSRTALPRQQTLRALIDWSYNLLSVEEKTVLRYLSLFVGGWTLEAAEAVCDNPNMIDLLTNLVDKSLVAVDLEHSNEPRYDLLEMIRQYGREKLEEYGEAENVRSRHLDYFVHLAVKNEHRLRGPDQIKSLRQLETEYDNIRAALEYSYLSGNVSAGIELAWSLLLFWSGSGHWREARDLLAKLLAQPQAMGKTLLRLKGLSVAGLMATLLNDTGMAQAWLDESIEIASKLGPGSKDLYAIDLGLRGYSLRSFDSARAQSQCEEALAIGREINDQWSIANILDYLGNIYAAQGDFKAAKTSSIESMTRFLAMNNKWMSSRPMGNLGAISFQEGDYESARSYWEAALDVYREMGDKPNIAFMLGSLANVAQLQGDLGYSAELYEESLTLWRIIGDEFSISPLLAKLGYVMLNRGNMEQAASLFTEGLVLNKKIDNQIQILFCLLGLVALAMSKQKPELAAQILGIIQSLTTSLQIVPIYDPQYKPDVFMESARASLGNEEYTAAYQAGSQMSLDEAVAYTLKEIKS